MKIELTALGNLVAGRLKMLPGGPSRVTDSDLDVIDTGKAWTLANDVLLFVAGEFGALAEVEELTVAKIAEALFEHVSGVPAPVLEEIVAGFVEHEFLVATGYPADTLIGWVCGVNLAEHPRRLELLRILTKSPRTAKELRADLGNLPVMTLRHHLMPLVEMGFVRSHRAGKRMEYEVDRGMVAVFCRRMAKVLDWRFS